MENTEVISVGIDVSKAKLDLAYLSLQDGQQSLKTQIIRNNETAIKKFINTLERNTFSGTIICESTGRYHLLLALLCAEATLDIRVINPLLAKKHTASSIRKNKSDKADSQVLARMIITESQLPKTFTLSKDDILIRQKMGFIQSLEKQIQSFHGLISSYQETQEKLRHKMSKTEKKYLAFLEKMKTEKKNLEAELEAIIQAKADNVDQQDVFDILQSIPGVSAYFARIIYQFLDPSMASSRQWIAYIGMDISVNQSGQKYGRTKLSKRGNNYLRKRFFCAGWGAAMNNKQFHPWYVYLREVENRPYKETILIIARKIIRLAFTLINSGEKFDPNIPLFSAQKF